MDEKLRFVFEYERDEASMKALCERFGISRETGYVWLRRYRQSGPEGLVEVNRAPLRHPNQTAVSIEESVLVHRQAHMTWGPRKLKRILERDQPGRVWPATSTLGETVKRAGLVAPRRKRRRTEPYTAPLAHAVESNLVWCADFKGWFKSGDGTRIDPLTITNACSRYLLRCQAVEKTDTERVRAIFEAAFRQFGLPWWIRIDNGPPFASSAVGGLSRLAVWWIKLGIVPERIEAGHPEQNGRHERMHRTLKLDLRPAEDWRGQQRELDRFRHDYNQVRPHESLGMHTPASVYEPSPRPYPAQVPEVEFPDTMLVRTIKSHGHFRWKKHDVFLSEMRWGERVGLLPEGCLMNPGLGATLPADALPPERATFGGRMTRKRCFQKGSLFKRGTRKKVWVARWWEPVIGPDNVPGRIRRSEVLGAVGDIATKREAMQMLDDLLRKVNSGDFRPQADWTFRSFVEDRWKPDVYPTLKFSSKKFYDNMVDAHLMPVFGDTQLRLLTKDRVQVFLTAKA